MWVKFLLAYLRAIRNNQATCRTTPRPIKVSQLEFPITARKPPITNNMEGGFLANIWATILNISITLPINPKV